ncbi:MAG: MopE-related protein, partial [Pseudomonadota bacterium]
MRLLLPILILAVSCQAPDDTVVVAGIAIPGREPAADLATASAALGDALLWQAPRPFTPDDEGFAVEMGSFGARFDALGAMVDQDGSLMGIRTAAWGRGVALAPLPEVVPAERACALDEPGCHAGIAYALPGLTEWWSAADGTLEQGWIVAEAPAGAGPLALEIAVHEADTTVEDERVGLLGWDGGALLVSRLFAQDADGELLPARFEPAAGGFRVVVEDAGARYPLSIDPTYTTVNFDDRSAPCVFSSAGSPAAFYTSLGLTLSGGFEVLNYCGNFYVTGYSSPNFLAWNTSCGTGTTETFIFASGASSVSLNAGSRFGGTATLAAYDSSGTLLASTSAAMSSSLRTYTVTSTTRIASVRFTANGAQYGVTDDLVWASTTDADGDGYDTTTDCDDTDATVHPGATEIWYDGIDQ